MAGHLDFHMQTHTIMASYLSIGSRHGPIGCLLARPLCANVRIQDRVPPCCVASRRPFAKMGPWIPSVSRMSDRIGTGLPRLASRTFACSLVRVENGIVLLALRRISSARPYLSASDPDCC